MTVLLQGDAQLSVYDASNRLINKGRIVMDGAGQSASLTCLDKQGTVVVVNGTLKKLTIVVGLLGSFKAIGAKLLFTGIYDRPSIESKVSLLGGSVAYL